MTEDQAAEMLRILRRLERIVDAILALPMVRRFTGGIGK